LTQRHLRRHEETQLHSEDALKEVWCAELLARLQLLDQIIGRGGDASTFEEQSKFLVMTRQHYLGLLKQLLVDGKLPMWNDLNPPVAGDSALGPVD
jgi:hypothetical protein